MFRYSKIKTAPESLQGWDVTAEPAGKTATKNHANEAVVIF